MIFSKGVKYSILNGIVLLLRASSTIIINKLVVVLLGNSGLLFLGNLKNVFSILQQISGAGVYEGIVKYTSGEYKNRVSYVLQAGLSLMLVGFVIAIMLYGVLSSKIFELLELGSQENSFKVWLSIGVVLSLICFVLHTLFQSFFHGKMEYRMVVLTSAISVMLTLGISIVLIYYFGKIGVVASVFLPSVLLLVTYLSFTKSVRQFIQRFRLNQFRLILVKPLVSYTFMSALAAVVFPSVFIYIRSFLTTTVSLEMAAYWEGYSKLSLFFSGLAISSISLYYLPKLTQATTSFEIREVVLWGLKFILLIGIPILFLLFVFGNQLIPLLYSDAFLKTLFLLKWELLGTLFKLLSFTISFLMIAKKMTKVFVVSEMLSGILFLVMSIFFINIFGVEGASLAYAITYFLYALWALVYFNGKFKFFEKN